MPCPNLVKQQLPSMHRYVLNFCNSLPREIQANSWSFFCFYQYQCTLNGNATETTLKLQIILQTMWLKDNLKQVL